MLLSPPTSPAPPAAAKATSTPSTGTRRPRRTRELASPDRAGSEGQHERRPPLASSDDDGDVDGEGTMRRTRSKTDGRSDAAAPPPQQQQQRRAESARRDRLNDHPRRPSATASPRSYAPSSRPTTPRSPATRPAQPPTAYGPAGTPSSPSSAVLAPRPRRIVTDLALARPGSSSMADLPHAAGASPVVLQTIHPSQSAPSSPPPSPFLPHAFPARPSADGQDGKPSSTSLLGRPAGQRHASTPLTTRAGSPRDKPGRPTRGRISLNLPAENERRPSASSGTPTLAVAGRGGKGARDGQSAAASAAANAEGSLRDVLGRFERSSSGSLSSTATLGRVRKTFLRGKTAPTATAAAPGPLDLAHARELAARESERDMARWADGADEVPQAVLVAEHERRSPLGEPFARATDDGGWLGLGDGRVGALLRKRPSQQRMVSSPAHLGGGRPASVKGLVRSSPSAVGRPSPLPSLSTSPAQLASLAAAAEADDGAGLHRKRPQSTSTSSIASSLHHAGRPSTATERAHSASISTFTSIRSEAAAGGPASAPGVAGSSGARAHLGAALRALTAPAPPSLAHSTPAETTASAVFARPHTDDASAAGSTRAVSQPAPLPVQRSAPSSAAPVAHSHASRSPSSSFDLDRCVAACRAVGDGWVSFAQVGVGAVPDGEQAGGSGASPQSDGSGGGRRWWGWLGGTAGPTTTTAAAQGATIDGP